MAVSPQDTPINPPPYTGAHRTYGLSLYSILIESHTTDDTPDARCSMGGQARLPTDWILFRYSGELHSFEQLHAYRLQREIPRRI